MLRQFYEYFCIELYNKNMDKKILLFGNNDGLAGVKVDMQEYKKFFKSPYGGNWNDNEIIERINISKEALEIELLYLGLLDLDYLIIVFSGHGGQKRETVLELNPGQEQIDESELQNIAKRQLNIYDCCRAYSREISKGVIDMFESKVYSTNNMREKYERRVMQAINQQVTLYACSIGEFAYDSSDGAIYSKNLLNCAMNREREYTLVSVAHSEAKELTTLVKPSQHPDGTIPKCLNSQQLILGLRP
jgi:delta-aminolevulinic acid dehydratase/porphobilinogen synthase